MISALAGVAAIATSGEPQLPLPAADGILEHLDRAEANSMRPMAGSKV